MNADADIQVWLETIARTQPSVIVPYVQSAQNGYLRYKMRAIKRGPQGRSVISQGGIIEMIAGTPVALGRMAISRSAEDDCQIELTIQKGGATGPEGSQAYQFSCPD